MVREESTLVVIPIVQRAHRIAPVYESVKANTPEEHRLLFVASVGDTAVIDVLVRGGYDYALLPPNRSGDYAKKINWAFANSDDALIFTGADDLQWHPGWLPAARRKMREGTGVVGTNDLGNPRVLAGQHATHFLIARWYANQGLIDGTPGIFYEGYQHEYVDDELVGTARRRKAWAFAPDSHVEHLHPFFGKAPYDPIYNGFAKRMAASRRLFVERRRLWR